MNLFFFNYYFYHLTGKVKALHVPPGGWERKHPSPITGSFNDGVPLILSNVTLPTQRVNMFIEILYNRWKRSIVGFIPSRGE